MFIQRRKCECVINVEMTLCSMSAILFSIHFLGQRFKKDIFVKFVSWLSVQTEHFVCSNVFSNSAVVILCQIQLKLGKKTERQM